MERFCFLTILLISGVMFAAPTANQSAMQYHEKPSLKQYGEKLKMGPEIAELVKQTQHFTDMKPAEFPEVKIQQVLSSNQAQLEELKKLFLASESFTRGEIDDEKVMNQILGYFQCSLLQIRSSFQKNQDLRAKEEVHAWMMFAADLPYEESSLISLRYAGVLRSLLLDELESMQKKFPERWGKDDLWLHWSEKIRASWPIDRIVLTESKKVLNTRLMKYALEIAASLQKNTYQSMEAVLAANPGGKAKELQFLKALWREEDILAMKTEVTRISAFRLRLAKAIYESKTNEKLKNLDSLISAKLISQIPINYLTGKPFELSGLVF